MNSEIKIYVCNIFWLECNAWTSQQLEQMSGGGNSWPKFMPMSFLQACISCFFGECFRTPATPIRKILACPWMLPLGADFSGRGWGQQLFSFQSPAVHWMARTSSLNCLSCRNPYRTPNALNCLPPFHWKAFFFTEKRFVASPSPKNRLECYPVLSLHGLKLCRLVSRSDLVLISEHLREAKPGGFQARVFPTFFGKGPDCVADPFGTVPRRCS